MATPRHAWQRPRPPRHASQRPRHALQRPRCPRHETWWYTTPFDSQFIMQQVGGFFFDVGLLGPCNRACRGRRGHCKACLGRCKACLGRCEACRGGRGRCQACLGVAKQAYTS